MQVERVPGPAALEALRRGVVLADGPTRPAEVELLESAPSLPDRPVPIRFRKNVPTAWLRLTLREGRNRQVRRMTAAVGFPTLRLVRVAIGPIELGDLAARPVARADRPGTQGSGRMVRSREPWTSRTRAMALHGPTSRKPVNWGTLEDLSLVTQSIVVEPDPRHPGTPSLMTTGVSPRNVANPPCGWPSTPAR